MWWNLDQGVEKLYKEHIKDVFKAPIAHGQV
jgi:hypothetical protein